LLFAVLFLKKYERKKEKIEADFITKLCQQNFVLYLQYLLQHNNLNSINHAITNMQTQPVYHYLTWVKTSFGNNAYNSLASNLEFTRTLKLNDWQLYGSSRLGVYNADTTLTNITFTINGIDSNGNFEVNQIISQTNVSVNHYHMQHHLANKQFELTNHLGNVLATILDRKTNNTADVVTAQHYYPFGSVMSSYRVEEIGYRFGGAGGQEKDDEIFIGAYTAEYWEYDSRLGRRWNVDPITYAWQSSYAVFNNNPIFFIDPLGLEAEDEKPGMAPTMNTLVVEDKRPSGIKMMWNRFKNTLTSKTYREYKRQQRNAENEEIRNNRVEYRSYGWSHEQNMAAANFQLTLATTLIGGGGLISGIRIGLTQGARLFARRAATDALAQFSSNMLLKNGDIGKSVNNINLIESTLAGFGVNPFSTASTSAAFQFSIEQGFQSTLTGEINANQFVTQTFIGTTFGFAGNRVGTYLNTTSFRSIVVGSYMRTSIGLGQRFGIGSSTAIYRGMQGAHFGISVTEEYLENK